MNITFCSTIPILRIFDVEKAKSFYVDFLGFRVDWEHRHNERSPGYIQISRDGLLLHLTEHHGDCTPGSKVFVWMQGIDAFHENITSRGYEYMRPALEPTSYGSRCVEVTDPFGNRISFNEKTPIEDSSSAG
ncbi:MAG: VOC family protein [Planctomycetaceae bacterium]|nr:VOC family protein [Planctomycetaceae bacterium]